jgi:hypothetical protein
MSTSARRIRIPYPDLQKSQRTYLTADYTSGTTVQVTNNEGFETNKILVAGEPGHEKCEAKGISSLVNKTAFTIASPGFRLTHNSGDVMYMSEYDAVEISYNIGSGWVVLQSALAIQWDQLETIYVHTGATDAYSYRFRFYNTVSGNYSEYSGTLSGIGYTVQQIGYQLQQVRLTIGDPDKKIVTDQEIIGFFNEAKSIIRAKRNDWWFWKREDLGTITTIAAINKYSLDAISSRIDYIADIRYRYVQSASFDQTYHLEHFPDVVFDELVRDNLRKNDDQVTSYNIMPPDSSSISGYIRCNPTPLTTAYGSFYVRYYLNEADYTSVTDTTYIPIPSLLKNFAISQCERIKGNETKAKLYERLFFGPPDAGKDRDDLMGIALLEQMQNGKGKPLKQPRQMKKFYGRKGVHRLFGERTLLNTDDVRERYF